MHSLIMRHSTTKTTEVYYARIDRKSLLGMLKFHQQSMSIPSAKNILIEIEKYLSGYA
jgi:hypothetical protein